MPPDLRGFGRSGRPEDVKSYRLANSAADMGAVLDAAGAPAAHVVGHDWGSAVAWATADLSRPGALTATLNWYRANMAPRMPGPRRELPPVTAPTMGVWSDGDRYLDGARMRASGNLVKGPWRYEEIAGATH